MAINKRTKYKLYITFGWLSFLAVIILFVFTGDNLELLKSIFTEKLSEAELCEKLQSFGWHGYISVITLSTLQVICAFLPAEPVQVVSGLTFGFPIGLLLCWTGVFIGNTVIFLLRKTFGDLLNDFFNKTLRLDFGKISKSKRCTLIIFILYFLPAIPYGMICFFAASMGMKYRRYIIVTMLGSLPSICIGVGLGYMAFASSWVLSVCVFAVLIVLLIIMGLKKDLLFSKLNDYAEKYKRPPFDSVQKPNVFVFNIVYFALRIYLFFCGVRIKTKNKIGKLEKPSIVLCNHGSFIDFIFAAKLIKKFKPNFIIARLYFYDKASCKILKTVGGFPKSMFAMDTESAKNCLRVLKNNGILAMMPEARLSTAGRFEDIQDSTYTFIKKCGVPVYTIKLNGDYLADPKWGKGFRRGSLVEAELDILYTADDIKNLSVGEIKTGVEERLYYNEFEWLEQRPNIKYTSKNLAEGLENILNVCPLCGQKHVIKTKKNKIFCEKCGYLTSLNNRYAFTDGFKFKNLAEWYDWQKGLMQNAFESSNDFSLVSDVELRLPSNGKGMTRNAGYGVCTLNRDGLKYCGTKDGEEVELTFTIEKIYRLLFGAGENFEIYNGTEILYFVPTEKRSAVDWYMASMILHGEIGKTVVY